MTESVMIGSVVIDRGRLCPKCRIDHEKLETEAGKKLALPKTSLCRDCKKNLGFGQGETGEVKMKRGRKRGRKAYGSNAVKADKAVKTPKLDRETKKFIKNVMKSGKKAEKLEAKAVKMHGRADELWNKAASMRAGIVALRDCLDEIG